MFQDYLIGVTQVSDMKNVCVCVFGGSGGGIGSKEKIEDNISGLK